ncbi:MAG: MaoC/PaaZ C-terminal domain-containing protein [Acidimicrobiia bacterium]|nr:MaoC/PaaZ C-terminal domain-containing protein [Acidimicrobiia bacterium]
MSTDWMTPHLNYDSMAWDAIDEGEELPPVVREVDATLVVVGAVAASRDFYPVHHDKAFAEQSGSPDVFVNILTTNGLMAAYVTNWCGPDWDLVAIDLRLKIPVFPGQTLTTKGAVTRKYEQDGYHALDIGFSADADYGTHCSGTATIRRAESA